MTLLRHRRRWPEAPPYANPESHILRPRPHTVDLRRSASKSTRRRRINRRRSAIPNDELCRWSMSLLSHRRPAAKRHPRVRQPRARSHGSRNKGPPKFRLPMVTDLALIVPPATLQLRLRDLVVSLKDQSRIIQPLAMHPQPLLHGHPQAGHWAQIPDCHHGATLTVNPRRLPLPQQMLKAASRSPRASNTPSPHQCLSKAQEWDSQALVNQAHSECSRCSPSIKDTGARTRLVRPWAG